MQPDAYVEAVLSKCTSLQEANFWPAPPALRPGAWLNNFESRHKLPAAVLLDHFIFYSDHLTDRVLRAALASLSQRFTGRDKSMQTTLEELERFMATVVFSPVEGEDPNPADSGYLFCRKIRALFELSDSAIATPAQAIERAQAGGAVVLVDDFVGSGEQVLCHWKREYGTTAGLRSLASVYASQPFPVMLACLAATSRGLARIRDSGLPLSVCVAHEIGTEYDIRNLDNKNLLEWFPSIREQIAGLLEEWAPKLILRPYMRQEDFARYGFHSFGLALGFQHSPCPDATLPIFWARTDAVTHTPLLVRHQ